METTTLWAVLTAVTTLMVAALILFYLYGEWKRGRQRTELKDDDGQPLRLPLTMLQVRALWALGIGTLTLAAIVMIFLDRGVQNYYAQDDMRILVYLVAFGGAAAYMLVHVITGIRNRGRVKDERDIAVLHWAPTVQVTGMTLTLAMWAIGLTEAYWSVGQLPIAYPILIFLSTLIVGGLFQALGILIGYRKF